MINAAAGLKVAGIVQDLEEGISLAEYSLYSGKAFASLQSLIKNSKAK